jgi:hypothetical protein
MRLLFKTSTPSAEEQVVLGNEILKLKKKPIEK